MKYEISWINERLTQECLVVGEKKTIPCRYRGLFVGEKIIFLVDIESFLWVRKYIPCGYREPAAPAMC